MKAKGTMQNKMSGNNMEPTCEPVPLPLPRRKLTPQTTLRGEVGRSLH